MKSIKINRGYSQVAITGIGIISSLGCNQVETLESLLSLKSGITKLKQLQTKHAPSVYAGEVKYSDSELSEQLGFADGHNYTRTSMLGCIAAKEAVNNAKLSEISSPRTALISATTVGGMDKTENYLKKFSSDKDLLRFVDSHKASDSTQKIADSLGVGGFVTTISTACSSAANAILLGARLIQQGKVDRAIVGGTDALSKFTLNGFKSLMILSQEPCTPFDKDRSGLNLGEAAAYLVLESADTIKEQPKPVLAYLSGFANTNDAYHQTASSENGQGAYLSMTQALKNAKIDPSEVDYINAHGTATPNNDLSEGVALKRIFQDNIPDFSSTKSYTGHTLAAAGAVEAVFSILALQGNVVFPNLNFKSPINETNISPVTTLKNKPIKTVLSNSFGFGGNCSTLIFSKG